MIPETKELELEELRAKVRRLEAEIGAPATPEWPPRVFYTTYAVLAGSVLGAFGAMASLLFNVVGSLVAQQNPLYLIQIYLTFPLGQAALETQTGVALAIGCCLYLLTGTVLGIPFQVILARWFDPAPFVIRFAVVTVLALLLWLFNFYVLISWLQPLLIGGNWILEMIPWWVAAATHLVFAWSILAMEPLGRFIQKR